MSTSTTPSTTLCACKHPKDEHAGEALYCTWWHGRVSCDCTAYRVPKKRWGRILDEVVLAVGFGLFCVVLASAIYLAFGLVDQ